MYFKLVVVALKKSCFFQGDMAVLYFMLFLLAVYWL